jgi:molecular chaperone DnaK
MVKDAEIHAEEDRRKRDEAQARNQAEALINSTETSLQEMGDKLAAEDKGRINNALEDLRSAVSSNNIEAMKAKSSALESVFASVAQKASSGAGAGPGAGFPGGAPNGAAANDDVVDAEYERVEKK